MLGDKNMGNNMTNVSHDAFLEMSERIRKSLMPLTDTLSEITARTSALEETVRFANKHLGEISDAYEQSMKSVMKMMKLSSTRIVMKEYKNSIDALQNFVKTVTLLSSMDPTNSIRELQKSMQSFTDSIRFEDISKLNKIDYSKVLSKTLEENGTFKDAVDAAYKYFEEDTKTSTGLKTETDFASEQEIKETISDQINNPVGFQERIAKWAEDKKKKYYIVVFVVSIIFEIFILPCLQNWGATVTTKFISNVKELPQKGAEVICQLKENFEATIIENTNYYYKVKFIDENGVEREGYVAKRNLQIMEDLKDKIETEKPGEK